MTRKLLPLLLIIFGASLLVATFTLTFITRKPASSSYLPLPQQLAGLPLSASTFGPSALDEFSRLHNKNITLLAGGMGEYGDRHQVTVWAAKAESQAAAEQLVIAMRDKINQVDSPFQPVGQEQINEITVFKLSGMGQVHFYFQVGSTIVWIASDEALSDQVKHEVIHFYQ